MSIISNICSDHASSRIVPALRNMQRSPFIRQAGGQRLLNDFQRELQLPGARERSVLAGRNLFCRMQNELYTFKRNEASIFYSAWIFGRSGEAAVAAASSKTSPNVANIISSHRSMYAPRLNLHRRTNPNNLNVACIEVRGGAFFGAECTERSEDVNE